MKPTFKVLPIMTVVLSLAAVGHLAGQTVDFSMRQGHPHPYESTAYPRDQSISVSASGAWHASITGFLSTGCRPWGEACFTLSKTSGNGPATITISFTAGGAPTLAVGVYTGTILIAQQQWTVRLTVLRRKPYATFFSLRDYPQGCKNSTPEIPIPDTCVITNERPSVSLAAARAPGTTYVDPQFGSPVHRLTGPGQSVSYATMRAFSATAKYILTGDADGFLQVWDRANMNKSGARFSGGNIGNTVWDPKVEDRLWTIQGQTISYRNVTTAQVTTVAYYGNAAGSRPAFASMDTGGTADNTDDNWWVFAEEGQKLVCAVDLLGLSLSNQEDHLYCGSYSALGITYLDFPQVTQIDSETHKRYVVMMAEPNAHVFSVNQAAHNLTYEYRMPDRLSTPHSDVGQDSKGRQVLFWAWYDAYGDKSYLATGYLNRGDLMTRPVEEPGGGLTLLYPIYNGLQSTDYHFGCSWSGYCVATGYHDLEIPSLSIAGITPSAECIIQTALPHSFHDGMQVVIGGASEVAGVNGTSLVHYIDSTHFSLKGQACTGVYRGTGHVAEAKQWEDIAPNRDEIVVAQLDVQVRRVAIHRSLLYATTGDLSAYWATPRTSISRDGQYVAYSSNLGLPEPTSVLWAEAGTRTQGANVTPQPAARQATLRWDGPEDAVIRVSPSADTSLPTFLREVFAGLPTEELLYGLDPDTEYSYQVIGKESIVSGTFHTEGGPSSDSLGSIGSVQVRAKQ